jgi:hypothetical protein
LTESIRELDVTVSSVDLAPATLTLSGWMGAEQAQYRVEVNGAISTVYFRGMIGLLILP